MNVFTYNSYKEFLKAMIAQGEGRGIISRIAAACGCDRTYISQVLNGKAELTPDHMIQLCDHLGMGEGETDYLMLLLLRDRSASLKARQSLSARLTQAKREALTVSNKVITREKPKEIREGLRTLYYSSWVYGAVHILTSIEDFQTAAAIAQKLGLPLASVNQVLKELLEMQVVTQERGRFVHAGADVYLPREYPQSTSHHLSWRVKAVERAQVKEDVHYTTAFSVSAADVEKLRTQVLELIESQRKLVRASGTEAACVFCTDFFVL